MARQSKNDPTEAHGRHDWLGLVLMAVSLVWLLALGSYDRLDVHASPPNQPAHNWIGLVGAHWADLSFLALGVSAFLVPASLLFLPWGRATEAFTFARRRWPWLLVLTVISAAAFDLNAESIRRFAGGDDLPGGFLGESLNRYFFHLIGYAGSTTVFILLYLLSLLGLSDFQLFNWIRAWNERRRAAAEAALDEEQRLDRKARQLEREARRLQEIVDRDRPAKEAKEAKDTREKTRVPPGSRWTRKKSRSSARTCNRFPNQPSGISAFRNPRWDLQSRPNPPPLPPQRPGPRR